LIHFFLDILISPLSFFHPLQIHIQIQIRPFFLVIPTFHLLILLFVSIHQRRFLILHLLDPFPILLITLLPDIRECPICVFSGPPSGQVPRLFEELVGVIGGAAGVVANRLG
jgi:hypothetical protein